MEEKQKHYSPRKAWQPLMNWIPYKCPTCGRDKGMMYLDIQSNKLKYVCFCGINIGLDFIKKKLKEQPKED